MSEQTLAPLVEGVRELVELVHNTSVTRLHMHAGTFRLEIESAPPTVAPAPGAAALAGLDAPAVPALHSAGTEIKALLIGVFYHSPAPGEPPFVEVGTRVEAGQQIAIVEAMKMMNPVVAGRAGVISAILVEDGDVVEFDQPLFVIEAG